MLSIDDRKRLIEYLDKNKDELKNIYQDFKTAIVELETKTVQEVLTKRRLGEIFHCSKLFLRFIQAINDEFKEE